MNSAYESRIAKKYAQAFLSVFAHNMVTGDMERIEHAGIILQNNSEAKSILAMPVDETIQKKLIHIFCNTFELHVGIRKLLDLLAFNYRLHLVPEIFARITKLYLQGLKIETVVVESTIELSNAEKNYIARFLSKQTGKQIRATYVLNKKLISGIRIQGDTFLWEYSIRKHLATIPPLLLRSEGLYGN